MESKVYSAPVSVVIPCYQATAFLERAVDSVLSQTLSPSELILIDDASPDDGKTKDLIKNLVKKINNKNIGVSVTPIFLDKNRGPGGARNAGWEVAKEPWIAFLDADDAWHPHKISIQYQYVVANSNVDICAHQYSLIDGEKYPSQIVDKIIQLHPQSQKVTMTDMLVSNRIPTRSVMLRREIPLRFPENALSEDYFLWLRLLSSAYKIYLIKLSLAYTFRPEYSDGGTSSRLWLQEKGELNAIKNAYCEGGINQLVYFLAFGWSILKFLRRSIIRKLDIHAKNN